MSDIDLVLILNEVKDAADLRRKLPNLKEKIKTKLRREERNFIIESMSETRFSVKFTVKGTNGKIDVDLLPTFHFEGTARNVFPLLIQCKEVNSL